MPNITTTTLAREMAEKLNTTPAEIKRWIDTWEEIQDQHLLAGETIQNTGRWTLELSHREPTTTRVGFGEQKGKTKRVPERYRPQFSTSPAWRDEMTAAKKRAERRAKAAAKKTAEPAKAAPAAPALDTAAQMAQLTEQMATINTRMAERAAAGKQPLKRDLNQLAQLQTQTRELAAQAKPAKRTRKSAQAQATA